MTRAAVRRPMAAPVRWGAMAVMASAALAGCAGAQESDAASDEAEMASTPAQDAINTLTEAERAAGWRLLFDGETLDGWRGYNMDQMPGGWAVEDGLFTRVSQARDIITEEQFGDFELVVDWRLEEGGNSGIFYRAAEGEEWMYHSAPEFQVLHDAHHPDGRSPLTSAGANYGLNPAPRGVVRPAGEWNTARILVEGDHVQHWLNGTKTADYVLGSDDWKEGVANSKFSAWPAYGQADRGHIGLQEHGGRVWFRNMKIREIW